MFCWFLFLYNHGSTFTYTPYYTCNFSFTMCSKAQLRAYRVAGNFQGRKLSQILRLCGSFLCEIWGVMSFGAAKDESFLSENHIFYQLAKVFSLESFPLYGMSPGSFNIVILDHMYIRALWFSSAM